MRYRGHYLPVEARREALRRYRDRRSGTSWSPFATGPLRPVDAMRDTVHYFEGWLAHAVAFGPVGKHSVKELTDQYRAAQFYLDRMYAKPAEFKYRPVPAHTIGESLNDRVLRERRAS